VRVRDMLVGVRICWSAPVRTHGEIMKNLTGKQKRYLRGLGHHLNAVVQLGQKGASESLVLKVRHELRAHELIKIRVSSDCKESAKEAGILLAEQCDAQLVQVIGRMVLLYRGRTTDAVIELP
jgi:RNA-binding protein